MTLQPLEIANSPVLYVPLAEGSIIGCIVKRPDLFRKALILSDDDFFSVNARKCFKAMKSLAAKRMQIDLVTLDAEVTASYGETESVAIMKWLSDNSVGMHAWNIDNYISLVKQASIRRQLIEMGDKMAQMAASPAEDVDVIIEEIRAKLRGMVQVQGKWVSISDVLLYTYEYQKGYENARADLTSFCMQFFYCGAAIAAHKLFGFGETRIERLLTEMQRVMTEEIDREDIRERCKRETGVDVIEKGFDSLTMEV